MKGIILADADRSSFFSSAKLTNKYLFPIFNRPMISYSIETMKNSGIRDILIVCGGENSGDLMQFLGSGGDFGVDLTFRVKDGEGGNGDALAIAEDFAENEPIAVIEADQIFEDSFCEEVLRFQRGAQIFFKKTESRGKFSTIELDERGGVSKIEVRRGNDDQSMVVSGFSLYDSMIFEILRAARPAENGKISLNEANQVYFERGELKATEISGAWTTARGTDELLEASILAQEVWGRAKLRSRVSESVRAKKPRVAIGIATFNSEKYVNPCIESLLAQDYKNCEIIIFDNGSSDGTVSVIRENFPEIRVIESSENIGFGRAHNEILRGTDAEFYACVNVDMIFEPNFISECVRAINEKSTIGSAGGIIKKWDFKAFQNGGDDGKTNFIDSVGLRMRKSHRFENIGEGEVDHGQFGEDRAIFGFSGAAVLYRRTALEDVAFVNESREREFFDESMFLYKEDIDLAYRLQWAGWSAKMTPRAVSFHDRTIISVGNKWLDLLKNRSKKSSQINRLSFLNHDILLRKNFSGKFSWSVRWATFWYNLRNLFFILIFETELLTEKWKLWRMRQKIADRRRSTPHRVSAREIERWMEM